MGNLGIQSKIISCSRVLGSTAFAYSLKKQNTPIFPSLKFQLVPSATSAPTFKNPIEIP